MKPRFRRSSVACAGALATLAALGLTGCNREPSAAAAAPKLAHPDLCQTLDRVVVEAALLGKVAGCQMGASGQYGYTAEFTSTVNGSPATLMIFYGERIDLRSGDDRWQDVTLQGKRVPLIGVGDEAAFDGNAAPDPQLGVLSGDRVVTVGLLLGPTGRQPIPQDGLADHLLSVADGVLALLKT